MNINYDVIIVGAGPVGLVMANLLGQKNVSVLILEQRQQATQYSNAIGISPASLTILHRIGLAEQAINQGIKIGNITFNNNKRCLGNIGIGEPASQFPYMLALPQSDHETLLAKGISRFEDITLRRGIKVQDLEENGQQVVVSAVDEEQKEHNFTARLLIAADGCRSTVRDICNIIFEPVGHGLHFIMGDYKDDGRFGEKAMLFFTPDGAIESFPMRKGMRRWIAQTQNKLNTFDAKLLAELVEKRSGEILERDGASWGSPFSTRSGVVNHFTSGKRVVFIGDAAHIVSPIGGQGMNIGFSDAEWVADLLISKETLKNGFSVDMAQYFETCRKKDYRNADYRARFGQAIGGARGKIKSFLRDMLLSSICKIPWISSYYLPKSFAMETLPYRHTKMAK